MMVNAVGTDYSNWYLYDLTKTQQTQAQRMSQQKQALAAEQTSSTARRFDTVEFTSDASEALQKRMVEKAQQNTEAQPYSESAKISESTAERTVNALKQEPQTLTEKAIEKSQSEDEFHIGLLDLIDSGTIELPIETTKTDNAPQIDFTQFMQQNEEIKPVDRNVSDTEQTGDITVTGAAEKTADTTALQPQQRTEQPRTADEIEKRTDISAPATKEKLVAEREKSEDSATLNTSDEIAQKQSAAKVTPAQQQGIQAYQRIQSYTNPYMMSMNAASNVA